MTLQEKGTHHERVAIISSPLRLLQSFKKRTDTPDCCREYFLAGVNQSRTQRKRQEQKNGQKVFHNENSILLFRMRGVNVQLQVERFTENEELFYVISKVTLKTGQLIGFSMFNGQLIFTLLCSLHIHALRIGWVF